MPKHYAYQPKINFLEIAHKHLFSSIRITASQHMPKTSTHSRRVWAFVKPIGSFSVRSWEKQIGIIYWIAHLMLERRC